MSTMSTSTSMLASPTSMSRAWTTAKRARHRHRASPNDERGDETSSSSSSSRASSRMVTDDAPKSVDGLYRERRGMKTDVLLGGAKISEDALAAWEALAPWFYPRAFFGASAFVALACGLPSSASDWARTGSADVFATNAFALAFVGFIGKIDVERRNASVKRVSRAFQLGDVVVAQRNRFREETTFALRDVRGAARVAFVYGDARKVERDLAAATPYRRRLEQSRILVVPVVERAAGGSERADVGPGRWELLRDVVRAWPGSGAGRWLAWPTRNDDWSAYFRELMGESEAKATGGYVTISTSGFVRGSGAGSPNWDVLLSTFPRNRPGNKDDEAAEKAWKKATLDSFEELTAREGSSSARGGGRGAVSQALPTDVPELSEIIKIHETFYKALDSGDADAMASVWASGRSRRETSSAVQSLVERGARIDGWGTVLKPDRRPQDIKINDVDVTIERDVATLTCLETVTNGATLLATQTFEREGMSGNGEWALVGHSTIPYGADVVAKVVLRCDSNGCVAVPARAVASSTSK